jgi:hypothetical protein
MGILGVIGVSAIRRLLENQTFTAADYGTVWQRGHKVGLNRSVRSDLVPVLPIVFLARSLSVRLFIIR